MANKKTEVLLLSPKRRIEEGLASHFAVLKPWEAPDRDAFLAEVAPRVRAIASPGSPQAPVPAELMARMPRLEIVSSFGVGYDHVDARWAGEHGVVVTNTPDVLTEEVADTAVGLLIATAREFGPAERFLRAGKWADGPYRLSRATLRNRTVGIVGLGRIGKAIARRLEAMGMPVVYHGRRRQDDVAYRYYDSVLAMARDVEVLMLVAPGGPETRHIVNARVLEALGSEGLLVNVARGSLVDEAALVEALRSGTILSAGLDVFADEPRVPPELVAMENVTLLPHVGSASDYTREQMDKLVVENLLVWDAGKAPLTPVPETPWRLWGKGRDEAAQAGGAGGNA